MQKINKRISPNHISELSECEIFVFGSNIDANIWAAQLAMPMIILAQNGAME